MKKTWMLALLLVVGGCSSQAAAVGEVQTSTAPVVYASAEDLARAVGCMSFEVQPDPLVALTQGECTVGSEGVVLATWPSTDGVVEYFTALSGGLIDIHLLVGTNWSANCDTAASCEDIAARLGGRYTYIPVS